MACMAEIWPDAPTGGMGPERHRSAPPCCSESVWGWRKEACQLLRQSRQAEQRAVWGASTRGCNPSVRTCFNRHRSLRSHTPPRRMAAASHAIYCSDSRDSEGVPGAAAAAVAASQPTPPRCANGPHSHPTPLACPLCNVPESAGVATPETSEPGGDAREWRRLCRRRGAWVGRRPGAARRPRWPGWSR